MSDAALDNALNEDENDQEIAFSSDELFFSRTDEKGIILSGNSIFQRISLYSWDELLNKPHNIIRHPDMPKAVFWLLWDTIKKGEPIGAYVKNRTKDGRYYWVFAIATPIKGGYLSVRLKPTTPILGIVEQEYKNLLAVEQEQQLRPAQSGVLLLNRLAELGFPDYKAFMSTALSEEIKARDVILGRKEDANIAMFCDLVQAAKSLLEKADFIFDAYSLNEYVPFNLRVQAAQLEEFGATVGVISNNYSILSKEIRESMTNFIAAAKKVSQTINDGLFLIGTANIQQEVSEFFKDEDLGEEHDKEQEMAYLNTQQRNYQEKALEGLAAISKQAEIFHQTCTDMKRLAAGLEVTRIMGKIESARLTVSKEGLDELIDDLNAFQASVANGLKEIDHVNHEIRFNVRQLLKVTK